MADYYTARSYVAKPGEVEQNWYVVDAAEKVVGRLARDIALILMGKHRPAYTPHVDTGEYVVVVNAEKVVFTGKKWEQKKYTWYTGYPVSARKPPPSDLKSTPRRSLARRFAGCCRKTSWRDKC